VVKAHLYVTSTHLISASPSVVDPGFKNIPAVYGPMGRGVEDLEAAARAVIGRRGSGKFYFPAPIPYRDVRLPKKLKFGYYLMDGLVKASPPCKRAVLETVEALRREGHECIEFAVPSRMYPPIFPGPVQPDLNRQSVKIYGNICCSDLFGWLSCLQARDRF
jgi:Asp-tRNA(Asn)/Glu-tRNA(Gln) amidotransferase A subunit family amidase